MKRFVFIRKIGIFPIVSAVIVTICTLFILPVIGYTEDTAAAKSEMNLKGKVIAVDAGHGGADPGAIGVTGVTEKEINLILAQKLETLLTEKGATVIMTRTDDSTFSDTKKEDLDHRADIVTKNEAELFLSIQCNAVPNHDLRGAQTFYYPESKQGKLLAEAIQARFIKTLENTDREAITLSSAYIMSKLEIPAIMVEVGFLSHPEEEALLCDDDYREKITASIYSGILDYYKKKDSEESVFDRFFNYFDRE